MLLYWTGYQDAITFDLILNQLKIPSFQSPSTVSACFCCSIAVHLLYTLLKNVIVLCMLRWYIAGKVFSNAKLSTGQFFYLWQWNFNFVQVMGIRWTYLMRYYACWFIDTGDANLKLCDGGWAYHFNCAPSEKWGLRTHMPTTLL